MSRKLVLTRLCLYGILVLWVLVFYLTQGPFLQLEIPFRLLIISSIGFFIYIIHLLRKSDYIPIVFDVFDVLLIWAAQFATDLHQIFFLVLNIILILSIGLERGRRTALIFAALVSLGQSIIFFLGPDFKSFHFYTLYFISNGSYFLAAIFSSILSEFLNTQNQSIKQLQLVNESIISTSPIGIVSFDKNYQLLLKNPAADQSCGPALDDLVQTDQFKKWIETARLHGFTAKQDWHYSKQGETKIFSLQFARIDSDKQISFLMLVEDLTPIKKMEGALRQSEKMAAIGQLASGIAHEIRNPLTGISGSIQMLSQNPDEPDNKKLFSIIQKEIDRLNRLISEFLDFAKPDQIPSEPVHLSDVLQELKTVIESDARSKNIKIHFDLQKTATIKGNRDHLKQAFLNIIINSLQAMETVAQGELTIYCQKNGNEMVVKISDTGTGMTPETVQRMFEPFHTTKPKGTGLGLAITHKILSNHSAKIEVQSELSKGTKIELRFPLSSEQK